MSFFIIITIMSFKGALCNISLSNKNIMILSFSIYNHFLIISDNG